jgi:hypothetical protein
MSNLTRREGSIAFATRTPWTLAGGRDPDFNELERRTHHRLLTDPGLADRYRRRFPDRPLADYDDMIRALGHVWECRHDHTLNVTGHLCDACREPRAGAAI